MFRDLTRKKQKLSLEECKEILKQEVRGVLAVNGDEVSLIVGYKSLGQHVAGVLEVPAVTHFAYYTYLVPYAYLIVACVLCIACSVCREYEIAKTANTFVCA